MRGRGPRRGHLGAVSGDQAARSKPARVSSPWSPQKNEPRGGAFGGSPGFCRKYQESYISHRVVAFLGGELIHESCFTKSHGPSFGGGGVFVAAGEGLFFLPRFVFV